MPEKGVVPPLVRRGRNRVDEGLRLLVDGMAREMVVQDQVPPSVDTEPAHDGDVAVAFDPAERESVPEYPRTRSVATIRIGESQNLHASNVRDGRASVRGLVTHSHNQNSFAVARRKSAASVPVKARSTKWPMMLM